MSSSDDFQLFYKDHTIGKIKPNIEEIENKNIRENQFINLDIITDTRSDLRIFQIVKNRFVGIDSLMSVMKKIPLAKDTIFLGFRLGMTKNEYRNHIKK